MQIKEYTSTFDLANIIGIKPVEIIKKCMEFGDFVSINQRLDADMLEFITNEFNFKCVVIRNNSSIKTNLADDNYIYCKT